MQNTTPDTDAMNDDEKNDFITRTIATWPTQYASRVPSASVATADQRLDAMYMQRGAVEVHERQQAMLVDSRDEVSRRLGDNHAATNDRDPRFNGY